MIDIHSHVLPGIDDGAASLEEAAEMCRRALADGCTAIFATPHVHHPQWPEQSLDEHRRLRSALQARLGLEIRVCGGAELRVDSHYFDVLDRLASDHEGLLLADSSYLLIEFDWAPVGPNPRSVVHETLLAGYRPIVAHPELYDWLRDPPDLLPKLVERGARLQVTAASLVGNYGRTARIAALRLLDANLVHFVASDCHNLTHRPPGLSEARKLVAKRYGDEHARRLFETNPKAILEDRELEENAA
ncbi:MAG: CpsB/CapC family capsule biosynthesis tyrosine phosphatase [Acidobacteriota bacterium]